MKTDDGDLQAEVSNLLAAALESDRVHLAEMERRDQLHISDSERRDQLHISETERRDVLHHDEIQRRQDAFEGEIETIRVALETRDLIGQAKGIIIATMRCTADEAFVLLKKQSNAENRKLPEIAAEIVATAQRRRSANDADN
jgi:hypothetical protein